MIDTTVTLPQHCCWCVPTSVQRVARHSAGNHGMAILAFFCRRQQEPARESPCSRRRRWLDVRSSLLPCLALHTHERGSPRQLLPAVCSRSEGLGVHYSSSSTKSVLELKTQHSTLLLSSSVTEKRNAPEAMLSRTARQHSLAVCTVHTCIL